MRGVYERKPLTKICEICGKEYTTMGNKAKYCPECKKRHDYEYFEAYNARRRKGVRPSDVPDVPADDYDTLEEKIKKTAPIETVLVPKKEDNMDTTREERLKTFPSLSNMTEHPEYFTGDAPEDLKQTTTVPADNGTKKVFDDYISKKAFDDYTSEKLDTMIEQEIKKDRKKALLDLYKTLIDIAKFADMTVTDLISRMTSLDAALN